MKMKKVRILQVISASLSGCFYLVAVAMGQPDQGLLQTRSHYIPPTPQQQAVLQVAQDQHAQLDIAAEAALHTGDYAQAEADARQSLAVPSVDILAPELLASALDGQGKEQEALQEYQMLADQGNSAPRNLLPYALLLLKSGQWAPALAAYEKALPLVPEQNSPVEPHLDQTFSSDDPQPTELAATIHVALGLTYNWECDWAGNPQDDKALNQYQQSLQLEPNWDIANYYYGYGLQKLGRTTQAQAAFTKTLKIAHGSVKVAALKALSKLKTPA